jgi:hypothetical protein
MALFIRPAHSQDFAQSAKLGFNPPHFSCLQVDAAPKTLIGSRRERLKAA